MSARVESVVAANLALSGATILARVPDTDRATDLALQLSQDRLAIVRSVEHAMPADHTAIATMISQGDFIWGAIVYSESAEPDPNGLIESFHIDQLDQLVGRLVDVREAFAS